MGEILVGETAPDFSLSATGGELVKLSQFEGQTVILYFYSKDNTSGCTNEAKEFREVFDEIKELGGVILGVSRDSISSHEKFILKHDFPFQLLSDPDGTVCQLYGVLKEKNMYEKKVIGVERSTFIIAPNRKVSYIFRKVKANGHAGMVLNTLKS